MTETPSLSQTNAFGMPSEVEREKRIFIFGVVGALSTETLRLYEDALRISTTSSGSIEPGYKIESAIPSNFILTTLKASVLAEVSVCKMKP